MGIVLFLGMTAVFVLNTRNVAPSEGYWAFVPIAVILGGYYIVFAIWAWRYSLCQLTERTFLTRAGA